MFVNKKEILRRIIYAMDVCCAVPTKYWHLKINADSDDFFPLVASFTRATSAILVTTF